LQLVMSVVHTASVLFTSMGLASNLGSGQTARPISLAMNMI